MTHETTSPAAEQFYEGAYHRIVRLMFGLAVIASAFVLLRFGAAVGVGFAVGCAIAVLNFHWLKRVVGALADRASGGQKQGSAGVVVRFLLRYLLVAAAAYAIFRVSIASLYGLLAGLFLPVAAILIEAVYEVAVAVRRGV